MPKRGLPTTIKMRHDEHFVEALSFSSGAPVGRMVPIDQVDPNPNQPRQVMGDLSELMASIAEKGVIEPLVVRARAGRYQIIAGERRYQASVQAGLRELPVVIREVDDTEVIELALIENLQRKDLNPLEKAASQLEGNLAGGADTEDPSFSLPATSAPQPKPAWRMVLVVVACPEPASRTSTFLA